MNILNLITCIPFSIRIFINILLHVCVCVCVLSFCLCLFVVALLCCIAFHCTELAVDGDVLSTLSDEILTSPEQHMDDFRKQMRAYPMLADMAGTPSY
jgi:hypothetical protein